MKKSQFYIVQIFWSLILTTVVWYQVFSTATAGQGQIGDYNPTLTALIIGLILYAVVTTIYIAIGSRSIDDWRNRNALFAVLISVLMLPAGNIVAWISGIVRA
jgi:hypothetical protein